MKAKISWDEIEVQENIGQTLVKILMLKGEKGDTGTTDYNDLLNKPTKLSDFTNDGVFITNAVNDLANYYLKSQTYTQTEINNLISVIPKFAIAVVNSLPTQDISTTTIYLVPSTSETTDMYKEYIYVNNAWELLGIQKADLTNYYTKSETDGLLATKADSSTVSTLSTQVGTNTSDISTLSTQVGTNTNNISTLNTTVAGKADSSTIGTLPNLTTTTKTDVVSAINEVNTRGISVTTLYSSSEGTQSPIILSSSAANYEYIEIFFKSNDADLSSRKVYSPDGKQVELSATLYNDTGFYLKTAWLLVSGTSVTWVTYGFARLKNTNEVYVTNTNNLYVTRILGINYGAPSAN